MKRRPRHCRTSTGKIIALTQRDIEVFGALARYRYLRSTYLHAFAGGASVKRFKERLGDLFHEGFINRPESQWQFADARYSPAVYELGHKARHVLSAHPSTDTCQRTSLTGTAHRQFAHSVLVCACVASIEIAARPNPKLRFISWPEILSRAPDFTRKLSQPAAIPTSNGAVVPDGLFGLEYHVEENRPSYRFFALEVDRGTMPIRRSRHAQSSLLAKLAAYDEIGARKLQKSHLGVPNLFLLTVTTSAIRRAQIEREGAKRGERPLFLFKAIEERRLHAPLSALLCESWTRAGLAPLAING